MKLKLWLLIEELKRNFWCRFFHRKHLCYPEVWGRGLAGPWHCAKCHSCNEGLDVALDNKPIKGLLWSQRLRED